MKKYFLFIFISYYSQLINGNSNESQINSNETDGKSASNMVFNMNIYGENVEVNLAENHKIVSPNLNLATKAKPDTNNEKPAINGNFENKTSGKNLKFGDYIVEVKPPNSSQIFNRRISKRSINSSLIDFEKSVNTLNVSEVRADKYLELAVFVDQMAYDNSRSNNLVESDDDFDELILGFVNQIQAIYYHKSLNERLHINIVKIEIEKSRKSSQFDGHRDELLKRFCAYQAKMNPESDSDPLHWDMALLLTGLDLYIVKDDGTKDYRPLGLGSVSGICSHDRNCVIAEFNSINKFGKPWPSSGLMSTWAAAHEMAHNLGILHDGPPFNNDCPNNGYLMSSSRGTKGETNWSKCSADNFQLSYTQCLNDKPKIIDQKYNHNKYNLRPGQFWNSDKQCKMFLKDNKAFEFAKPNPEICNQSILCATPKRIGFYPSGPALEGTYCGKDSSCVDGICQKF